MVFAQVNLLLFQGCPGGVWLVLRGVPHLGGSLVPCWVKQGNVGHTPLLGLEESKVPVDSFHKPPQLTQSNQLRLTS